MKLQLWLVLFSGCVLHAQTLPPQLDVITSDAKHHADAVRLIEVSGVKKKIQDSMVANLTSGVKAMAEKCSACSQAFYDEWVKRMSKRLEVDALVAVYVNSYEKYLTDAELIEVTRLQEKSNAGEQAPPSDALRARLVAVFPSMQSEISAGCVQITSKLGAEVGGEIGAEHPDWVLQPAKPAAP